MTTSPTNAEPKDPGADNTAVLTDFTTASTDLGWFVLNDNVMGGRSRGSFEVGGGELLFTGDTNTTGGGFSSIRTKLLAIDLSQYAGIRLKVMGDGRRYTWRLGTNARFKGNAVSYWAQFNTQAQTWITVDLPFSEFVPIFRGYELDGPGLDTGSIEWMGLMINDKNDGPFTVRLASVAVY